MALLNRRAFPLTEFKAFVQSTQRYIDAQNARLG